jgi:hypothetical protein
MLDFEIAFAIKQEFDEMLDECYPTVEIGGVTFYPSQIVKDCDPIAYRVWLSDWEADAESRGE